MTYNVLSGTLSNQPIRVYCLCLFAVSLQNDDPQETMPLSSFYIRKRPARQILFSPPHLSKTASPGLVCVVAAMSAVEFCHTKLPFNGIRKQDEN